MRREIRANWSRALLVCGKCSKKVGRVFGPDGDLPLAKALRRELGGGKGRKAEAGVAEVKCLGVCPKGAVVALDAARPGRWLLVRPEEDLSSLISGGGLLSTVRAELVEGRPEPGRAQDALRQAQGERKRGALAP